MRSPAGSLARLFFLQAGYSWTANIDLRPATRASQADPSPHCERKARRAFRHYADISQLSSGLLTCTDGTDGSSPSPWRPSLQVPVVGINAAH